MYDERIFNLNLEPFVLIVIQTLCGGKGELMINLLSSYTANVCIQPADGIVLAWLPAGFSQTSRHIPFSQEGQRILSSACCTGQYWFSNIAFIIVNVRRLIKILLGSYQCCSQRSLLGPQNYHSLPWEKLTTFSPDRGRRGCFPIATKMESTALHITKSSLKRFLHIIFLQHGVNLENKMTGSN